MRAGHDDPEGGQLEVPRTDPNAGNMHSIVALSGRDDTDHPRSEGQSQ